MEHKCQIIFDGWWGQESALISKNCLLYDFKNLVIKKLCCMGILELKDIDIRNQTPHVKITDKSSHPQDENTYKAMNNKIITLSIENINIHNNWIAIDLGNTGILDAHMTIIYKKGIINHKEDILEVIKEILHELKPNGNK